MNKPIALLVTLLVIVILVNIYQVSIKLFMDKLVHFFIQSDKAVQGVEKLVLYRLLKIYGYPFEIRESLVQLSSRLRLSTPQVTNSITFLAKAGFLDKQADFGRRRGRGQIIKTTERLGDHLDGLGDCKREVPNAKLSTVILDQITNGSRLALERQDGPSASLPIESKGQILLASLVAFADGDGVVENVAFSTFMDISGLKRAGVQGVIRSLKDMGVIIFYLPGRLQTSSRVDYSSGRRTIIRTTTPTKGIIYLDLSKLGGAVRAQRVLFASDIGDDFIRWRRLAGIYALPNIGEDLRMQLAAGYGIGVDEYLAMSSYKKILGRYADNREVFQSLIIALYSSLDSYFSKREGCPFSILRDAHSVNYKELTDIWGRFGFRCDGVRKGDALSISLLQKHSERVLSDVRNQFLNLVLNCECKVGERCMSMRFCPLGSMGAQYLLLIRPLSGD